MYIQELERAWEQDGMQWAKELQTLLKEINQHQIDNPELDADTKAHYIEKYQHILAQGDVKCPPPDKNSRVKGQRVILKRTKSRPLLELLRNYQDDVLRFMAEIAVHEKISECFRSMQGTEIFCLIRSYLSTCRKQDVSASLALELLFKNQLPDIFIEGLAE
ncbi:hypothetical protein [Pseudoalteromonas sp.]|uniref:hypothetical protein n=1 Tax=Pseudoalteromonas sp. TaxID=53249 RepID=UPI002354B4C3|nr:hypothetical protein [Pseudoalteromonas sp.]